MRRDPADQRARLRQAADRVIAQAAAEAHADADDQYLSFLGCRRRITKSAGGVWSRSRSWSGFARSSPG